MNYRAEEATADILCFVHPDTTVPEDVIALIIDTLRSKDTLDSQFIVIICSTRLDFKRNHIF